MQLLTSSQRSLDKPLSVTWPPKDRAGTFMYVLTVINYTPQKERRNWTRADGAHEVGEMEWSLNQETPGEKQPVNLWTMRTSDVELVLNLIADSLSSQTPSAPGGANPFEPAGAPSVAPAQRSVADRDLATSGSFSAPVSQSPQSLAEQQTRSAPLQLSGTLSEVELSSVMQSIGLFQMTGKLSVYGYGTDVEIFFVDGELVHALSNQGLDGSQTVSGEAVILDVFTWEQGGFQFQNGWKQQHATITKRMPSLIMEGAALRDYRDALAKAGLTPAATLARANPSISEPEFDAKVKQGLPLYLDLQKRVFISLRAPMTFESLLDSMRLPKSVWMPVIFSLINTGLLTVSGAEPKLDAQDASLFSGMDAMIEGASKMILQSDTGMLNYALYLLLLQNECARFQTASSSFCTAVIEIDSGDRRLNEACLRRIADCFNSVKRPFDSLAHLMPNLIFLLLPHSSLESAHQLIRSFLASVSRTRLDSAFDGSEIGFLCGLAAVPDDAKDAIDVLSAASRLRRQATKSSIATSRPLENEAVAGENR